LVASRNLTVCDPDAKKLAPLKRGLGVMTTSNNTVAIKNAHVILLAVKPQKIYAALEELRIPLKSNQLIISIAAGVTIRSIEKIMRKRQPIVRAMPNLPLTVGVGVTAWCVNTQATPEQQKTAQRLLSTGAIALKIPERKLDAVTAISGSGPGYVFAFADALMRAAQSIGLSQSESDVLVRATIAGAGKLVTSSLLPPSELASRVASKGGTTEAALKIFKQKKLAAIIAAAVRAAHRRARQLSR
jgi:pyrroline-5-carboxylate reductase